MAFTANRQFLDEVALGNISGYSARLKFGNNPDIDAAQTEDCWEGGGTYTFISDSGAQLYISSSSAADTMNFVLLPLVANAGGDWNVETITVTLAGQTKTAITVPSGGAIARINRARNDSAVAITGTVYIYEDDTVIAGVPQTASKIRAIITPTNDQTLMAIDSIPSNSTGLLHRWHVSIDGPNAGATITARLYVRTLGKIFLVKDKPLTVSGGSPSPPAREFSPPLAIPAQSDVKIVITSDANNVAASGSFDMVIADG